MNEGGKSWGVLKIMGTMLWLLFGVLALIAVIGGGYMWRRYMTPEPHYRARIEVIESAPFDGKRRLVLIRRDDREHLLLTGGPVDVVIETGIESENRPAPAPFSEPAAHQVAGSDNAPVARAAPQSEPRANIHADWQHVASMAAAAAMRPAAVERGGDRGPELSVNDDGPPALPTSSASATADAQHAFRAELVAERRGGDVNN